MIILEKVLLTTVTYLNVTNTNITMLIVLQRTILYVNIAITTIYYSIK
jgi:hypothetical protein